MSRSIYLYGSLVFTCSLVVTSLRSRVCWWFQVFGNVTKGMDVVKTIEGVGSRNGQTSKAVVISDCGQLS